MSQSGAKLHDAKTVIRSSSSLALPRIEHHVGEIIGHFQLMEPLGVGGMASVWKACRVGDESQIVALKLLPSEFASNPELLRRFQMEAQAAGSLDHPNIAKAIEHGESNGQSLIAFEYVPGRTLRQTVELQGPISPLAAVRYMRDCVFGLAHAASRNVVHRDVKPANIMITQDDHAKLIDMGLARQCDALSADGGLTTSGVTLGTYDYVSPEQAIDPRRADFRSDLYSLGCTFYFALTGTTTTPEGTAARKLQFHQHEKPVDPRKINPAIPFDLALILSRLVMKNPAKRYDNANILIDDLTTVEKQLLSPGDSPSLTQSHPNVPLSLVLGLSGLVIAILMALSLFTNDPPRVGPASKKADVQANVHESTNPPAISPDGFSLPVTGEELAEALRQGESKIRLQAGRDYDLTTIEPVVFHDPRLIIETAAGDTPAKLILPGQIDTVTIQHSSLVEFRNITFKVVSIMTERQSPAPAGIEFLRCSTIDFQSCQFDIDEELSATRIATLAITDSDWTIRHCLFRKGAVAIRMAGQSNGTIRETAFGPHEHVFDLNPGQGTLSLIQSTILLKPDGCAVFDLREESKFTISQQACMVGVGTVSSAAMMPGQRQPTVFARTTTAKKLPVINDSELPNVFFHIDTMVAGETVIPFERRAEFGLSESINRPCLVSPWLESDPLSQIGADADPWRAFRLRLELAAIRIPRGVVVGVRQSSPDQLARIYPGDWPPPRPVEWTADPVKIWQPAAPAGASLGRNSSRHLDEILSHVRAGDVIEIKHDGNLTCPTIRWNQPNGQLTIRSALGSHPILISDQCMLDIVEGQLALENLSMRLERQGKEYTTPLQGIRMGLNAAVTLKQCTVTLDETKTIFIAAAIGEAERMKITTGGNQPRIRIEESMIRGTGQCIAGSIDKPFHLEIVQSLIAIDGPVITMDSSMIDDASTVKPRVMIDRTTLALAGPLMQRTIGESERVVKPVEFDVNQSLISSVNVKPLVIIRGQDSATPLENLLTWQCDKPNRMTHFNRAATVVEMIATDPVAPAMTISLDRDEWQKRIAKEPRDLGLPKLTYQRFPKSAANLIEVLPDDFRHDAPTPIGCNVSQLPKHQR